MNRATITTETDKLGVDWVHATYENSVLPPDYKSLLNAIKALGTSVQSVDFNNNNLCYNQHDFKEFLRQLPANISGVTRLSR